MGISSGPFKNVDGLSPKNFDENFRISSARLILCAADRRERRGIRLGVAPLLLEVAIGLGREGK